MATVPINADDRARYSLPGSPDSMGSFSGEWESSQGGSPDSVTEQRRANSPDAWMSPDDISQV